MLPPIRTPDRIEFTVYDNTDRGADCSIPSFTGQSASEIRRLIDAARDAIRERVDPAFEIEHVMVSERRSCDSCAGVTRALTLHGRGFVAPLPELAIPDNVLEEAMTTRWESDPI